MSCSRKIIFPILAIVALVILIFVVRDLSQQPSSDEIAKGFPADSYQVFKNGKNVTLYSIQPESSGRDGESFHGFLVLGKTLVNSENSQVLLKHFLLNAIPDAYGAACFNPRHGLRITDNEKTLDLVICFECGHFVSYYGDQKGESSLESFTADIIYNQILKNSDIELSK